MTRSYFLDSSALVKRYIDEEGTQQVQDILQTSHYGLIVSRLAMVEVTSATVRRGRQGGISAEQLSELLDALNTDLRELLDVVELGGAIITRAVDLVRVHALRAADGIQLASALIAAGGLPERSQFVFVSSDVELNAAAEKEGLAILDPQHS